MRAYLKRHLFDGGRLRRRTLEEFTVAMRSGRLIAFVGSFATNDIGYPAWTDFLQRYASTASACLKEYIAHKKIKQLANAQRSLRAVRTITRAIPTSSNPLTVLSVIEQALVYADEPSVGLIEEFDKRIGFLFELRSRSASRTYDVSRIATCLGVDRIITINYDLEFEWQWMVTATEKSLQVTSGSRQNVFSGLVDSGEITEEEKSLSRILPSGRSVISDVFSRDRIDRLIEFSVGSPDYEAHILHLHGIARHPGTMVVSQWDYNLQYRRSGITKLPFEHGLRVLFAGNPLLFIGAGMTEGDVTATLEQIVSDHPDRRIAPAFMVWNRPPTDEEKEEKRFTWLHRFGILTLFDDELDQVAPQSGQSTDARRFSRSIVNLGHTAERLVKPYGWKAEDFRDISCKLKNPKNAKSGHYDIWPPAHQSSQGVLEPTAISKILRTPITLVVGRPGGARGSLAKQLRREWERTVGGRRKPRSMVIHSSFVFEVESVFSLISGLADNRVAAKDQLSRRESLVEYVSKIARSPPILIVINGMERFFSPSGQPLSAELDGLLRLVAAYYDGGIGATPQSTLRGPPFRLVVIGTKRVERYFDYLFPGQPSLVIGKVQASSVWHQLPQAPAPFRIPSYYYQRVAASFERRGFRPNSMQKLLIERKATGDLADLRRFFYSAYLRSDSLRTANVANPDLCLEILMVMAFIGQPVEDIVPFHAPKVRERLKGSNHPRSAYKRALSDLERLELIVERAAFEGSPSRWRRYGLHRSLLTEMRDRVGVPLSDSKLSSGFNISLFAAQPVDGYSPEQEIHEDLTSLVDWFIGAYKDEPYRAADAVHVKNLPNALLRNMVGRPPLALVLDWKRKARPHASACLRAALAVVRNYYSTAALLTLDTGRDISGSGKDAPLSEHAELLDRLIMAATDNSRARAQVRRVGRSIGAKSTDWVGPPPFYPDDLVWLHNERGVVKLTQGDLYEARHSFEEALRLNSSFVEFSHRGQNWRRIMLNQLHVDIERARLDRAEERIGEIEQSLGLGSNQLCTLIERYGKFLKDDVHVVDADFEQDTILSIGLLYGYRGLCMHLRGELHVAGEMFQVSLNILENIGEQRAYAMFQRHAASLKAALGKKPEALDSLKLAMASSEATRQTDIAHYARISEAWHSHTSKTDPTSRSLLIRRLQQSLLYAEMGDMHRVRVEAGLNLARVKFEGGDHDAALEKVADAMATATRYGMSLRKISLRILMGQILMRRGDRISGPSLIERAIRNADRVGYQGAVGLAQRVQALEEKPLPRSQA